MEEAFLDTNVLVRHFVYDPVLSPSATKCLEAIAAGKLRVWTTMLSWGSPLSTSAPRGDRQGRRAAALRSAPGREGQV
jgi:predicted nucleic acid-binding protein